MKLVVLSVLFMTIAGSLARSAESIAAPATAPTTAPTTGRAASSDYEIYDWVVFVCDPTQPPLNGSDLYPTALPSFINDKRSAAPAETATTQPSPIGVIRLVGTAPADGGKIDVVLESKSGRFNGHWPKSKNRADRLVWDNLEILAEPRGLEDVVAGHWYRSLREGGSAYLRRGESSERFLLYDVEPNYSNPLRLTGGADQKYQIANGGGAFLHDVQIYKPVEGGWRVGGVAELPGDPKASPPATAPAPQPAVAETKGKKRAAAAQSASPVVTVTPFPAPATQPAAPATLPTTVPTGVAVPLETQPVSAADAVRSATQPLAAMGLPEADVDMIGRILQAHALHRDRLTVVYRLDPTEMDRMLPLEVTPSAKKVVRIGLVILRNVDPGIGDEVQRLIAELGEDDWEKREAAQKKLTEIGPAAKTKLQEAIKQKDLEVVWRAEQLLELLTPQKSAQE